MNVLRQVSMYDPFEQFERSRLGLMIPLLIFLIGAVPTALAIRAMIAIESRQGGDAQPDLNDPPGAAAADVPSPLLSPQLEEPANP